MLIHTFAATVREWFEDDMLRRIYKHGSILLGGNVASAVLGLATLAVVVRGLGPESYGALVLIVTYTSIIDKLINFQTWQALIKFGAGVLDENDLPRFKQLTGYCRTLDVLSAMAAAAIAWACVPLAAAWLDWNEEITTVAQWYPLVILFNLTGVPMGVLRLCNRFSAIALQGVIMNGLRLVGVAIAYAQGAEFWVYVLIWGVGEAASNLYLLYKGQRVMAQRALGSGWKLGLKETSFNGLWHFVWTSNLLTSVRVATRELDILFIGGILGPSAAGMYQIVKQFASVILRITDPLTHAIFPEMARLISAGNVAGFKRIMLRTALLSSIVGIAGLLLFYAAGQAIITIAVGSVYLPILPVLLWYLCGSAIAIMGFGLQPAMLTMGRTKQSLWCLLITTLIYYAVLYVCLQNLGLIGAGIAYLVFMILWSSTMLALVITSMRETHDSGKE